MANGDQIYDTSQLDEVQHPRLGLLKFPHDMPYDERNQIIKRMESTPHGVSGTWEDLPPGQALEERATQAAQEMSIKYAGQPWKAALASYPYNVAASIHRTLRGFASPTGLALAAGTAIAPEVTIPVAAALSTKTLLEPRQPGEDLPGVVERRLQAGAGMAGSLAGGLGIAKGIAPNIPESIVPSEYALTPGISRAKAVLSPLAEKGLAKTVLPIAALRKQVAEGVTKRAAASEEATRGFLEDVAARQKTVEAARTSVEQAGKIESQAQDIAGNLRAAHRAIRRSAQEMYPKIESAVPTEQIGPALAEIEEQLGVTQRVPGELARAARATRQPELEEASVFRGGQAGFRRGGFGVNVAELDPETVARLAKTDPEFASDLQAEGVAIDRALQGEPLNFRDAQNLKSALFRRANSPSTPPIIRRSLLQAIDQLRGIMRDVVGGEHGDSGIAQYDAAEANWGRYAQDWLRRQSPVRQAMQAENAADILRPLTGKTAAQALDILERHGVDTSSIRSLPGREALNAILRAAPDVARSGAAATLRSALSQMKPLELPEKLPPVPTPGEVISDYLQRRVAQPPERDLSGILDAVILAILRHPYWAAGRLALAASRGLRGAVLKSPSVQRAIIRGGEPLVSGPSLQAGVPGPVPRGTVASAASASKGKQTPGPSVPPLSPPPLPTAPTAPLLSATVPGPLPQALSPTALSKTTSQVPNTPSVAPPIPAEIESLPADVRVEILNHIRNLGYKPSDLAANRLDIPGLIADAKNKLTASRVEVVPGVTGYLDRHGNWVLSEGRFDAKAGRGGGIFRVSKSIYGWQVRLRGTGGQEDTAFRTNSPSKEAYESAVRWAQEQAQRTNAFAIATPFFEGSESAQEPIAATVPAVPSLPPVALSPAAQGRVRATAAPEVPGVLIPPESTAAGDVLAPPPGPRWYADRGAVPGEPAYYLDVKGDDLDTAKAVIIEREDPRAPNRVRFEVQDSRQGLLGVFGTLQEAAKTAEGAAIARKKRDLGVR